MNVTFSYNSVKCVEDSPLFTIKELEEAGLAMKNEKMLWPNSIPAEAYKLMFYCRPNLLLSAFNVCLKGTFLFVTGMKQCSH